MGKLKQKQITKTGPDHIARILQRTMATRSVSDVELAARTGLPRTTVRTYIHGTLKTLDLNKLDQIARALDTSLPDVLSRAEAMRGFFKKERSADRFDIISVGRRQIRIECQSPLNPHHMHGQIHFLPGLVFEKKTVSERDIWVYLKSEGGIITLTYNGETSDLKGGDRTIFNARYPFKMEYLTDDRNRRKLAETEEAKREIICSFSSNPPFWLY